MPEHRDQFTPLGNVDCHLASLRSHPGLRQHRMPCSAPVQFEVGKQLNRKRCLVPALEHPRAKLAIPLPSHNRKVQLLEHGWTIAAVEQDVDIANFIQIGTMQRSRCAAEYPPRMPR